MRSVRKDQTFLVRSNWSNIISAAFNALSIFSWALLIECVLIYTNTTTRPKIPKLKEEASDFNRGRSQIPQTPEKKQNREIKKGTCVGRMAVSRAERRWSKEPRIPTMLSVMVWLFCRDSFIRPARSVKASIAWATPIFLDLDRRTKKMVKLIETCFVWLRKDSEKFWGLKKYKCVMV